MYPIAQKLLRVTRARVCGLPPLLKDPLALFSTPWLAARFDLRVIVMIRHPAAFASSLKRLNWEFDFRHWLDQPLLMRDYLYPFEREFRLFCAKRQDIIEQAILLWNAMHTVIRRFQLAHPSWIFLRHEDLAKDPLAGFQKLYQQLGLPWSSSVVKRMDALTNNRNVKDVAPSDPGTIKRDSRAAAQSWTWRLTEQEIERIRYGTSCVSPWFYPDSAWHLATPFESRESTFNFTHKPCLTNS